MTDFLPVFLNRSLEVELFLEVELLESIPGTEVLEA
jgi:hypothetical protein